MLKKIIFVFFCAVFLSGCYYTIEPIYTEKDKISDDGIVSTWVKPDKKEKWCFEKDEKEKTYKLLLTSSEGVVSTFKVNLVKIGKYKYLDMFIDNKTLENQTGEFRALLLGCHFFIRYSLEKDKLMFINYGLTWIEEKIANKELDLHYFKRDGGYYFSDSTEELQKAIIAIEDTKEAFEKDPQSLERVK